MGPFSSHPSGAQSHPFGADSQFEKPITKKIPPAFQVIADFGKASMPVMPAVINVI